MKNVAIYTAIFGDYDDVVEPITIPTDTDFILYTDCIKQENAGSWTVIKKPSVYEDPTRNARYHKVLPHRLEELDDYQYSIWVDGNMSVRGDVNELIKDYLNKSIHIATFDHNQNRLDPRDCVYKEAEAILYHGRMNMNFKDDPDLIAKQIERYREKGYPEGNSLAVTMAVLRKHSTGESKMAMEKWWEEIEYGSKRDQLSFNYAMTMVGVPFIYFDGDSRANKYFQHMGAHNKR